LTNRKVGICVITSIILLGIVATILYYLWPATDKSKGNGVTENRKIILL